MGGFGSGRPSGSGRDTVEACRSIDVNRLHREGCLRAGWRGGWQWTRDGEQVASINLRAERRPAASHLSRAHRRWRLGRTWPRPSASSASPAASAASRPYFICPGVVNGIACGRRVAKLYGPGRYFLCRHCYRLAYASQSEGAMDRALRRANKIRQRLGGDPGMAAPFPTEAEGHVAANLRAADASKAFEAEMRADEAFALRPNGCWRGSTIQAQEKKGDSGNDTTPSSRRPRPPAPRSPASTRCATACCRATPCCPGRMPTNIHAVVAALVAEHAPQGPTEEHLVEELAGILWRKRRLRLAEAAAHRRGLEEHASLLPRDREGWRWCISTPPTSPSAWSMPFAPRQQTPRRTSARCRRTRP